MHGWHLNKGPALDEITVTVDRHVVASRPLPRELSNDLQAWDRALTNFGYARPGDWEPVTGGHRSTVAPL
jgi:hypothetical protein